MTNRCAIYLRCSKPEETSEKNLLSADSQEMFIRRFIQQQENWTVHQVYHDNGFTAKNLKRPGIKELLHDAECGLFDQIVVYRYDRLTRDSEDYFGPLKSLERRCNVKIVSATEPYDSTTPEGKFSIGQTILHAQLERERTGLRTKHKVESERRLGHWTGGNVPLGYKSVDKKLVPDERLAPLIVFMFKKYVETQSPAEVARCMGLKALELPEEVRKRLGKIDRKRVTNMLRRRIYKGDMPLGDEVYKGQHEAIVDEGLWEQVQRILPKDERKTPIPRTQIDCALKGRIRCQECNSAMLTSFTTKGRQRYAYHTCLNKHNSLHCKGLDMNISADLVKRLVVEEVRKILKEPEALGGLWQHLAKESSPEQMLQKLQHMDQAWNLLTLPEQDDIVKKFVKTVWLSRKGLMLELTPNGVDTTETATIQGYFQSRNHDQQVFVHKENPRQYKDPTLLKALVYAEIWYEDISEGRATGCVEIAANYGLSYDYVWRVIYLEKLPPKIKKAILEGKLNLDATTLSLKKFPAFWAKQEDAIFRKFEE
jgi:DNA invertase Pin-like site-specific DNA recombinase